jgi:hypothetical protein
MGQTADVDDAHLAGLGRVLQDLLLASYGMYPEDLEREVVEAARHLGGSDVVLLVADYDQQVLVGFNRADERRFLIDGPGPGLSYRQERVVEEKLGDGRRRLWIPSKDSAERHGVLGVVDDGSVADRHWEDRRVAGRGADRLQVALRRPRHAPTAGRAVLAGCRDAMGPAAAAHVHVARRDHRGGRPALARHRR